jgi:phospholipid/cholesterol/gamma-HCH transport system substrate-binding protein
MGRRVLTLSALALAVVAAAVLMFGAAGGYRVEMTLDNAGQLVRGDQVKIGGYPVGTVEGIELDGDARARIALEIDDGELAPLHEGTVATVRSTSLSGIANRYVALEPGPNNRPEIPDGGEIRAEDGREAVDLDQLLNTLDSQTQRELSVLVRRGADLFASEGDGRDAQAARQANAGLEALNPALGQSARTLRALTRDERDLERLVVEGAGAASAATSRPADLDQLVGNALGATGAVARESVALESAIGRLPATLRRTNTTLVNLRSLLGDVRPLVADARPAAPLLSAVLDRLRPLVADARPLIARTRSVVDRGGTRGDLLGVLQALIGLSGEAVPALESTVKTVQDALPVVREARPYTPDLIGGLFNGFGGTTAPYYDANGHYARISFQGSVYTATGAGALLPRPPADQNLSGYDLNDKRCPGAATQPVPDGSNPYVEREGFPCDPEDTPK